MVALIFLFFNLVASLFKSAAEFLADVRVRAQDSMEAMLDSVEALLQHYNAAVSIAKVA
jgi:hypothetical protein